ncbi:MAG: sigma factor [Candidatus Poribacteria bacterium]|nr:sigma factor [Candidatus Poribacteria bacterium]MDP6747959.1 sigma factor [Candidatus Poribacteria bacterium]MDP6995549.1 sigma factor [Candidatus Poribacteria bacterium]
MALKYRPQGLPVEDLVQEGCIDLMRAVFSPEDVVPLPTLAFPSDYS